MDTECEGSSMENMQDYFRGKSWTLDISNLYGFLLFLVTSLSCSKSAHFEWSQVFTRVCSFYNKHQEYINFACPI